MSPSTHPARPLGPDAPRPILIGVVHLLPLPGAPRYGGAMGEVLERAAADVEALFAGGVDGVIVENYGDVPFRPGRLEPETVAAMALAVERAIERAEGRPVGVNCLRNDARAALGVCAATGASFLRINVHSGAAVTDQGLIQGQADETLRERARLGLDCDILVDVHVKHATPLGGGAIGDAARDAFERGLAGGLIASGTGTGQAVAGEDLEGIRDACPEAPLWIGSGLGLDNISEFRDSIDGALVGSAFQRGGRAGNPVEVQRVRDLSRLWSGQRR